MILQDKDHHKLYSTPVDDNQHQNFSTGGGVGRREEEKGANTALPPPILRSLVVIILLVIRHNCGPSVDLLQGMDAISLRPAPSKSLGVAGHEHIIPSISRLLERRRRADAG